ncbi:hypothetical protein LPJ56_006324 [Coemansia sp. RSA 2599]|nr:hypothetical protein LPJ56_006324 [Coemansia sp. RSA 2599]
MESAFGRLYRTSKLASFDREIKQVYATYSNAVVKGDWGLKRKMPPNVGTRLITLDSMDTKEQIMRFDSANPQYMLMNVWKENFLDSTSPAFKKDPRNSTVFEGRHSGQYTEKDTLARSRGPQRSLVTMTRKEWNEFLAEARARRSEWKQALEEGNYAPEETLAFMNATNVRDSQNDGVHRSPTYHNYVASSEELEVKGRVLNRTAVGYAVAVQGIVAYLPYNNHRKEIGLAYRSIKTFYVHSATFDSRGRPEVELGLRPRSNKEDLSYETPTRGAFDYKKPNSYGLQNQAILDRIRGHIGQILPNAQETPDKDAVSEAVDYISENREK